LIYFDLIDQTMQFFSAGRFQEEAVAAKEEFCRFSGVMDEGHPGYEMKFNQFVDWFLFTRPLGPDQKTPMVLQVEENPMGVESDLAPYFRNLASSRHGLFLFVKLSKTDLTVKDLFSGYKFLIKDSAIIHGFEKDSPFEGRLIPDGENFLFSNSFCFHPTEAKKYILAEIKKIVRLAPEDQDAAREELILRLFRMKHRFERYTHVPVKEFYTNESRIKF
jgi:hypothetical protein